MKFKELKHGMVIYCCDDNDMDNLLKELERLGYKWYSSGTNPTDVNIHPYQFNVLHLYDMDMDRPYKHITHSLVCKQPEGSLSYSDVVIEEPLLSSNNVNTVATLLRFNGMISEAIYRIIGVVPNFISSYDARMYSFPELVSIRKYNKKGEEYPIEHIDDAIKKDNIVLFGAYPFDVDKKTVMMNII